MSFLDKQSGHKIETQQAQYPTLVWYNGKVELKPLGGLSYFGGLGLKAEQANCDQFPVGDLIQYTYSSGHTEDVWAIGSGDIALMATRLDWYTKDENDEKKKVWHEEFRRDRGMRGMNHCLVILRGAEAWHQENGLLRLTFSGVVNGMRFAKQEPGSVIYEFNKLIHKPAEKANEHGLDTYTFYMPVHPDKHQLASQNYSSKITPPVLGFKEYADLDECLAGLYIGDVMMEFCAEHWQEAQEWAKADNPFVATNDNGLGDTQEKEQTPLEKIDAALDDVYEKHHGNDDPRMQPEHEEPPPRNYEDIGPPPEFNDIPF